MKKKEGRKQMRLEDLTANHLKKTLNAARLRELEAEGHTRGEALEGRAHRRTGGIQRKKGRRKMHIPWMHE